MQLHTDVCDSTVNVFEKILIEVGCQRGSKELLLKASVNEKVKAYVAAHKKYPNTLVLGIQESQYFKKDFKIIGKLGEIFLLRLEKIDSASALQVFYKGENDA